MEHKERRDGGRDEGRGREGRMRMEVGWRSDVGRDGGRDRWMERDG